MPARSKAQQRLMGADLQRARHGKATRTGMNTTQLAHYAGTARKSLPERIGYRQRLRGKG